MLSLVLLLAEGGILLILTAFVFNLAFNIMDNAMAQSTSMMNAIDSGNLGKIQVEAAKTGYFMKSSAYSALNFLKGSFSAVDTSNLGETEKTQISDALDKIEKIKAQLDSESNEELEKDLKDLEDYLKSLENS